MENQCNRHEFIKITLSVALASAPGPQALHSGELPRRCPPGDQLRAWPPKPIPRWRFDACKVQWFPLGDHPFQSHQKKISSEITGLTAHHYLPNLVVEFRAHWYTVGN